MAAPATSPYHPAETAEAWSISLHSTEGGADKIYNISIEPSGDLWLVNYANGRRGGSMATGTKTQQPVAYAAARLIATKLLNEKSGKGYNPISGSRFADGAAPAGIRLGSKEDSGFRPQLLNPVAPDDLEDLLNNDTHGLQIKYNGERRLVIVKDRTASGTNRKGEIIGLGNNIAEAASTLRDMVVDSEDMGDLIKVFDILELDGRDLRGLPYENRMKILVSLDIQRGTSIALVETIRDPDLKRHAYNAAKAAGAEGVVFKDMSAPYQAGRPNSGGDWQKFKFYNTLSAIVSRVNDKRSVRLALRTAEGQLIDVGNVTIPANHSIPAAGDVAEIRYLHAFAGGALNQPTYLGPRADIAVNECLESQRVYEGVFEYVADEGSSPRP